MESLKEKDKNIGELKKIKETAKETIIDLRKECNEWKIKINKILTEKQNIQIELNKLKNEKIELLIKIKNLNNETTIAKKRKRIIENKTKNKQRKLEKLNDGFYSDLKQINKNELISFNETANEFLLWNKEKNIKFLKIFEDYKKKFKSSHLEAFYKNYFLPYKNNTFDMFNILINNLLNKLSNANEEEEKSGKDLIDNTKKTFQFKKDFDFEQDFI